MNKYALPGRQHQRKGCGSSLERHPLFFPTVQELDLYLLGCERNHVAQQKNHPVQPICAQVGKWMNTFN